MDGDFSGKCKGDSPAVGAGRLAGKRLLEVAPSTPSPVPGNLGVQELPPGLEPMQFLGSMCIWESRGSADGVMSQDLS